MSDTTFNNTSMESQKIYLGNAGGSDINTLLASALSSKGLDPNVVLAQLGNRNGGFFGGNGIDSLIALVVIFALIGSFNGNGNGFFGGNGNNAERELIAQMIQRNGTDLSQLSQTLGCSIGRVNDAVTALSNQICTLAGQQGLSFQQVINSILSGQSAILSQLTSCCCDLKQAINGVNVGMERGFSSLAFETQRQTCDLEKSASANTAAILAKLDAIEDSRKDRELAEKDRVIATLTARSERQAELQPIYKALGDIQCNQVPVKKIACPETYVPVNTGINATYGLIPTGCGFYGYGAGYGGYPYPSFV